MNRYIDAEWLIKESMPLSFSVQKWVNEVQIMTAPSIDIVFCKECKHWQTDWNPEEGVDNFHFCPMVDRSTFDDWFCADGERREP